MSFLHKNQQKAHQNFQFLVGLKSMMRILIVRQSSSLVIEVGLRETILEIKQKIEHFLSIPVASQILSVSTLELIDGLDLEDYPFIGDGTKIDLSIKSIHSLQSYGHNNHHRKIQITVKFSSRKLNIEVDSTDTVRSLKEKIHIIDGTPLRRMSLYMLGVEMDDDFRNLSEYGVHEFSEIIVFLKTMSRTVAEPPCRKLRFVVQTSSSLLNGSCIPLEMKDSSTTNELRGLMMARKMLPADDYIFIHKQRIMRDNCSLRWHGVGDGDYLYVFKGTVSRGGY